MFGSSFPCISHGYTNLYRKWRWCVKYWWAMGRHITFTMVTFIWGRVSDYWSMLPTQQFLVSRALRCLVWILLRGLFRKNSAIGKIHQPLHSLLTGAAKVLIPCIPNINRCITDWERDAKQEMAGSQIFKWSPRKGRWWYMIATSA